VQYAFKALAGMRHGEVAALAWRAIDYTAEPLARINVVRAYNSATQKIKTTKTEDGRAVPMHPTLAKILATWRLSHWSRLYGRQPTPDDLVVPTRNLTPIHSSDAVHAFKADLEALGLRVEAGERRDRGEHDLRGWYKTRCIEDGADSLIIRRTTHAPPRDVNAGYERFTWATICREVAKLRVDILGGEGLPLATNFATTELKVASRWQKVVTPLGLERVPVATSVREDPLVTDGEPGSELDARGHERTQAVASLATALADAVLSGDHERARALAEEVRALEVNPAAPPLRRVR